MYFIVILKTVAFVLCLAVFMYLVMDNVFYMLNKRRN
ncbi:MAG: hypothetical protein BWY60_00444 [Actinobacteria bacterium ADurb.Bin346]|nr:MAG: hypothetical protein BWY60_00444 [Actinobacteria bacterium ADurb.Bin346]